MGNPATERGFRMSETVQVEAARIPDRDRLLKELQEVGLDAHAVEEVCIEVPCGNAHDEACDELLSHVEGMITSLGAPFVPIKHEGVIYIRPPTN